MLTLCYNIETWLSKMFNCESLHSVPNQNGHDTNTSMTQQSQL